MASMISDFSGFIPSKAKFVGRYFLSDRGRSFHDDVTCSVLLSSASLREVTIVDNNGVYEIADHKERQGSIRTYSPCSRCKPLEPAMSVQPLGTTNIPCYGMDREWVTAKTKRMEPEYIFPEQKKCMGCPVLSDCYSLFRAELPEYGVMGGVTFRQYQEWGDSTLEVVKGLIFGESEQEADSDSTPSAGG